MADAQPVCITMPCPFIIQYHNKNNIDPFMVAQVAWTSLADMNHAKAMLIAI
jgi:hypothetical protein